MTSLRTLPVAVHPGPDETLHSWLTRLSARLTLEPRATMRAIGYPTPSSRAATYPGYGVTATDAVIDTIGRTTRAPAETIRRTLLGRFDGGPLTLNGLDLTAPGGNRQLGMREWVHLGTSSACIACLIDSGYQWRLTWRLPWTAVCTTHQLLLEHQCPQCGLLFNAGRRRDHGLGPGTNSVPVIEACTNSVATGRRAYAPLCGHPYSEIPTTACEHPDILAAQTTIDRLLTPEHRNHHLDWWQNLRAVTAVLLTHANPDLIVGLLPGLPDTTATALYAHYEGRDRIDAERHDTITRTGRHHSAPRRRTHTQAPTNPALVAALLPVALATLRDLDHLPPGVEADGPLPAGGALDMLRHNVSSRNRTLTTELNLRRATPQLLDASKQTSGYDHLAAKHTESVALDTRFIPRLFPWADYQPVRDILTATGTTDDYARSYLSLCAAKLVLKTTWADAATALLADPDKATRNANAVTTRLTASGQLHDVHHHVAQWLQRQANKDPATHTDYRALRSWHAHHLTVTRTGARRLLTGTGLKVTDNRRRCLAIHRWHEEALEPLAEWPGWVNCTSPATARDLYRRFTKKLADAGSACTGSASVVST